MRKAYLRALMATTVISLAVMTQAPSMASAAPPIGANQGLAKGRLLHMDGSPAAGATVTIYAMPVETAQDHFSEGDSGEFAVIGQFRADRQGRYAAAVKRANLARFRDASGNVNAELIARDASGNIASMTFGLAPVDPVSPQLRATSADRAAVETSPLTPVSVADLTLATGDQAVAKNSSRVAKVGASAKSTGDPATRDGDPGSTEGKAWVKALPSNDAFVDGTGASDIVAAPAVVCGWSLVSDLGNKTVWVGGTYVKATGVTADLQYQSGSSSSLGVGVSTSGAYGSFSASGSVARSSTGSIDFPTNVGFQHDYTQFRYGKYGYWCDTTPGYRKYQVYARYWSGGSSVYAPSTAPSAPYCVSNFANTTFTKSTTTAYNFSTGADTSGSIGIDLSSQTGYTTALKLVFKFTSTRQLCGTNGFPGSSSPKRLVATA